MQKINNYFIVYLLLLLNIIVLFNCKNPTRSNERNYTGQWSGKTFQDSTITFSINESGLASIYVGYFLQGDYGYSLGTSKSNFEPPKSIQHDSLTADLSSSSFVPSGYGVKQVKTTIIVSGKFQSSSLVKGIVRLENTQIRGNTEVTFSAEKQ